MEFIWCCTSLVLICLYIYFLLKISQSGHRKSPGKSAPEAAGGWPFIGHLNLLSGPEKPHLILSDMADKYGPIFSIRLGVHRCLIVSSWEVTKEIYTTNDVVFSDRPETMAIRLLSYDFAMFGFNRYCSYWREVRKICLLKLLSNNRVSMLGGIWEGEIRAVMKSVRDESSLQPAALDLKKCFEDLILNTMVKIVAGSTEKKLDSGESEKWRVEIREFFKMMGVLTFSDGVPFLKWVDYFKGTKKALKKTARVMDSIVQSWLENHKKLPKKKGMEIEEDDFMEEMMEISDSISQEFPRHDADTINKATCQAMILAGTDTMTVTLTWTVSLLLNNRHVLKRAQQELDNQVGRSRKLEKSDVENLVYLRAIIKETLRLYPPTLLVPPRESSQDCIVAGYHVPAGTRLMMNLWKLHRDPSVWSDPLEFKPERFLTENRDLDVRGQHFQFLPFGCGRRICPGITFATHFIELALALLLHGFDMETPSGGEVDMEGSLGTVNVKATPLQVLLRPRLSLNLYD